MTKLKMTMNGHDGHVPIVKFYGNKQHDRVENDHEWSCSYDSIVKFYGNKYLRSTT